MRDKKTYAIIGAAMEVHKELGNGFLEAVYQEALEKEFINQGIPYNSQPVVKIYYKKNNLRKSAKSADIFKFYGSKSLEHKRFVYTF